MDAIFAAPLLFIESAETTSRGVGGPGASSVQKLPEVSWTLNSWTLAHGLAPLRHALVGHVPLELHHRRHQGLAARAVHR